MPSFEQKMPLRTPKTFKKGLFSAEKSCQAYYLSDILTNKCQKNANS